MSMQLLLSMAIPSAEARLPPPPGLQDLPPSPQWHCAEPAHPAVWSQEPVKLARTAAGCLTLASMSGIPVTLALPKASACDGMASTRAGTPTAASQASECNESAGSAHEEAGQDKKKKRSRFCKAKRDHYRRLVEQLVQLSRESRGGLCLDAVRLPKSIACSQEAREKLLATVHKFAGAEA